MRSASGQVPKFAEGFDFFPGARTDDEELNGELLLSRMFGVGLRLTKDTQGSAGTVQMSGPGRKQPCFKVLHGLMFFGGLFHLGKSFDIGVSA